MIFRIKQGIIGTAVFADLKTALSGLLSLCSNLKKNMKNQIRKTKTLKIKVLHYAFNEPYSLSSFGHQAQQK